MVNKDEILIEVIGHASVLIRVGHSRVLCDPHLNKDFRGGLFTYYPARSVRHQNLPRLDAIVLSHSHRDHFDIASLNLLERTVPVFCPADRRIHHVLERLAFKEIITVEDWTHIRLNEGIEFLWTPSTYRVPEHGLAIKAGNVRLWNLVDTHVRREWVAQVLALLDCSYLDVVMLPCQPLLETAIVDALQPAIPSNATDEIPMVIETSLARYVVPFADGHYCSGRAAWLNHQKFPYSPQRIERLLHTSKNPIKVMWVEPAQSLLLKHNGKAKIAPSKSTFVARSRRSQNREFHPGGWIEPIYSSVSCSCQRTLKSLMRSAQIGPPIAERFLEHYQGKINLQKCFYRLSIVGAAGRVTDKADFYILKDGRLRLRALASGFPDIEMCMSEEDFLAVSKGELGYSAALLGGRIREYRSRIPNGSKTLVIEDEHDEVVSPVGAILSGTCVVNLLLMRLVENPTAELDVEIEACLGHRAPARFPSQGSYPSNFREPVSLPRADYFAGRVWRSISAALKRGQDPSEASGAVRLGDRLVWFGILGQNSWPNQNSSPSHQIEGRLVLFNLVEAQPHMGAGVRFPHKSYEKLVSNIMASPVVNWRVEVGLPEGVRVPRWRCASLMPIDVRRLIRDLRKRGWKGQIAEGGALSSIAREWWLGTPRMEGTRNKNGFVVEISRSLYAKGEIRGLASTTKLDITSDPMFRLDFSKHPSGEKSFLKTLLEADFRFSWVLQPDDTVALFPKARQLGYERWIEMVAIKCVERASSHMILRAR